MAPDTTTLPRTRSSDPASRSVDAARPQLVLIAIADLPQAASSRHLLDDVDEVRFGRSERSVARDVRDGRRVLELRLPDRRTSAAHGRLIRGPTGWTLEDPASKNATVIDGVVTRRGAVGDGALIEIGHSFYLFREAPVERDAPDDLGDAELVERDPAAALHTYDGALAERFADLRRVAARSEICVLLQGESGTGKEVVARALHAASQRSGAFVPVHCDALAPALVEAGLIRSADGGTLFLDEIGELPATAQTTLLRVLQDREVPVGGDRAGQLDFRLCAATLRDLDALVTSGGFRTDLRSRLVGLTLELPALRQRRADLGLLIRRLLARIPGGPQVAFKPVALRALLRYHWPGNIRELERTLQTAVALAREGAIESAALPEAFRNAGRPGGGGGGGGGGGRPPPTRAPADRDRPPPTRAPANRDETADDDRGTSDDAGHAAAADDNAGDDPGTDRVEDD